MWVQSIMICFVVVVVVVVVAMAVSLGGVGEQEICWWTTRV